jgi:tRNA-guanine family transglycosylase
MNYPSSLSTRGGVIDFPAYVPVTTFGDRYPLDDLIRPYLRRLAPAMMISFHYAKQMKEKPSLPLMIDSGGFASLFSGSKVIKRAGLGIIEKKTENGIERIEALEVLDFQEQVADIAFTLDFPIPPDMERCEATKRLDLTIANAHWALKNRRRKDMPLYACVQAWDVESARSCAEAYAGSSFEGIAIGGLVPRARNRKLVLSIVDAVREVVPDKPVHVFGLGKPDLVKELYEHGVQSVDSSSYVKLAASGRLWTDPMARYAELTQTDRLNLAICNLAAATGKTLPLSTWPFVFQTMATKVVN